ncbi:hypothetical protein ND748_00835 [Frankia sp. AiPs1]|nr:hypothetical protein [Frankia sp. AiPs1]MCM3920234.1 hypothetical protein [Frankia sp. AiPs1]
MDGSAERHEHPVVDLWARSDRGPLDSGDLEGVDPAAQPCGHDLPDGVQRAHHGFLDAGTSGGGDLECDGQSGGLLVVEQQRG